MLNIAICDDGQAMRYALREVIEKELHFKGVVYQINEFESGEEIISNIRAFDYDVIFLDIEMKKLNGISTAKEIRDVNKKAVIIFVTAYPDFVFQGYEVRALDYILKPYKSDKIAQVIDSALEVLDKTRPMYFTIEKKSGSTKIALKDIIYFSSDRRHVILHTTDSEYIFYKKLTTIEKELPDYFVRIHNRYLVNMNYVTGIDASSAICSGRTLPVSRQYKQCLAIAFAKNVLGGGMR